VTIHKQIEYRRFVRQIKAWLEEQPVLTETEEALLEQADKLLRDGEL